jgi:hypothetical protein
MRTHLSFRANLLSADPRASSTIARDPAARTPSR